MFSMLHSKIKLIIRIILFVKILCNVIKVIVTQNNIYIYSL